MSDDTTLETRRDGEVDIIERAEAALNNLAECGEPLSATAVLAPIIVGLIAALKVARAEHPR
jgi:hypothetical protein